MNEADKGFWSETQKRIAREISRQNYETWVGPVKLNSISGDGVVLDVPNRFFKEWLLEHYFELLTRTLGEVLEKDEISLSFRIIKDEDAPEAAGEAPRSSTGSRPCPRPQSPGASCTT